MTSPTGIACPSSHHLQPQSLFPCGLHISVHQLSSPFTAHCAISSRMVEGKLRAGPVVVLVVIIVSSELELIYPSPSARC